MSRSRDEDSGRVEGGRGRNGGEWARVERSQRSQLNTSVPSKRSRKEERRRGGKQEWRKRGSSSLSFHRSLPLGCCLTDTSRMLFRTPATLTRALSRRPVIPSSRSLASRPHPLSSRVTPRGPVPVSSTAPKADRPSPRLSVLSAILLATLTGSATYLLGRKEGLGGAEVKAAKSYREPTQKGFESAWEELKAFLPEDCIAEDRDTLVAHGWNDWGASPSLSCMLKGTDPLSAAAHGPSSLPGGVVYPRSTEDVVRIVKIASKYAVPLIPYCAGTSLEGHTTAIGYPNNPSEKQVHEKIAKGEHVVLEDLVPGLALVVDFAENMNQIISLNAQDLDAVVQPSVLIPLRLSEFPL